MDREAWSAAVPWVTKGRTRLSDWTELNWTELRLSCRLTSQRSQQLLWFSLKADPAQKLSPGWVPSQSGGCWQETLVRKREWVHQCRKPIQIIRGAAAGSVDDTSAFLHLRWEEAETFFYRSVMSAGLLPRARLLHAAVATGGRNRDGTVTLAVPRPLPFCPQACAWGAAQILTLRPETCDRNCQL